jgi:hypothetical protein
MTKHPATPRRAVATAFAAAVLALAGASTALAAPGDFTVTGPASFPAAVAVGETASQTFSVTNHTSSSWEFGGVGYPPHGNSDLSWSVVPVNSCPSGGTSGVIAACETCTFVVNFAPNAAGVHSLNFQLNFFPIGGGFGDQANIETVTATAFDVSISLSPAGGLAFPEQPLSSVGAARAVTVSALHPSTTVRSARVTGDALNDFLISNDGCSQTTLAAAGDHCTIWLRFAPTALGSRSAALEVTAGSETKSVSLTGTSVAAAAGPQGPAGPQGDPGPAGPTGPAGPAGKIACRNTAVAKVTCQILFAPGTWTTSRTATRARYTVRRGNRVIARGTRRVDGHGRLRVRLPHGLRRGRYRVTVTVRRGRHAHSFTRTVSLR